MKYNDEKKKFVNYDYFLCYCDFCLVIVKDKVVDEFPDCSKYDEVVIEKNSESGKYYILKNSCYVESKIGTENIVQYAGYYKTDSFMLFAYDKKISLQSNSGVYSNYVFGFRIVQFCDNLIGGVYIELENGILYNFNI